MNEIYIEIDGQPVPAKDVVWLQVAPCGCIDGVTSINRHSNDGERYTDGETAFNRDSPKVLVEKLRRLGYTYEGVTWDDYRAIYSPRHQAGCSHDPKWGVDPIPVPDGYTWMTTDGPFNGRRTYRKHLVKPVEDPATAKRWARHRTASLCGQGGAWTDSVHELHDTVECTRCEKRARKLAGPDLRAVSA